MPDVHYGVIIRNGTDLIAARSVGELLTVLEEMTDGRNSIQVHIPLPGLAMAYESLRSNDFVGPYTISPTSHRDSPVAYG